MTKLVVYRLTFCSETQVYIRHYFISSHQWATPRVKNRATAFENEEDALMTCVELEEIWPSDKFFIESMENKL